MLNRADWGVVLVCLVAGCAGGDDVVDSSSIAKAATPKKCKEHKRKDKSHGDCTTVTTTVGVTGGTVTTGAGGITLQIPFGALDAATPITITTTDAVPPTGIGAVGPVFEFQPEGLVFSRPVRVTLPMPAGVSTGQVYWSQLEGPGFDAIGGTIAGGMITTQTVHFSLAVIGSPLGTQTLLGTSSDTYLSSSDDLLRPQLAMHSQGTASATDNPSSVCAGPTETIEAIVSDGVGGYARLCGAFSTDRRSFTIPGVPLGGDYIVHTLDVAGLHTLLVASANNPDIGTYHGGRPFAPDPVGIVDPRTPISGTAHIDLTVQGMAAPYQWQAPDVPSAGDIGDTLELWSTEADNWWFQLESLQPPADGASSVSMEVPMEIAANEPSLIEAAKGDRTFVGHLSRKYGSGGAQYLAMTQIAELPGFSTVDNATVMATANLGAITADQSLSLKFDAAGHRSALLAGSNPATNPYCAFCGGVAGMFAQGNDSAFGFYTANADLLILWDKTSTSTTLDTGPIMYAQPDALGGHWGKLGLVRWTGVHFASLPGSAGPGPGTLLGDGISWTPSLGELQAAAGTLLQVKMKQPTGITVDTHPFFTATAGLSTTPTVQWVAPVAIAPGNFLPLFYSIDVKRLRVRAADNLTVGAHVARVNTPDTSFTFPPGILDPGESYVFSVTAYGTTSTRPADTATLVASPFKTTISMLTSTVSSAFFTTAP